MPFAVRTLVPLAPLTTLELGGAARFFCEAAGEADVAHGLEWAADRGLPVFVLGGGSNVVVGDGGFDGLVLRVAPRGLVIGGDGVVDVAAGEPWDAVVAAAVDRGLAGLECLSGIPGLCGAVPVQNVGAYGQDVSETIRSVRVLDRRTRAAHELAAPACAFGYRDSALKRDPERYVVLGVSFALRPGGAPAVRYAELRDALADRAAPSLADVRRTVLELRRRKSMVIEPDDPNRRSVGSFFMNPVLPEADAARVIAQAMAEDLVNNAALVPQYPARPGLVKIAAGWLIERAGIPKGFRAGAVGVSSRHALALVHHGGGSAAELVALARHVRDAVLARFGVRLEPEPTLLGATLDGRS